MILELQLKGFQSFGLGQELSMKPLTFIFGPNSSGKSSLGRALRFLKQSCSSPTGVTFTGDQVNLTNFDNTVFKNKAGANFTLGLFLRPAKVWFAGLGGKVKFAQFDWSFSTQAGSLPETIQISALIEFEDKPTEQCLLLFSIGGQEVQLRELIVAGDPGIEPLGSTVLSSFGVPEERCQDLLGRNLVEVSDVPFGVKAEGRSSQVPIGEAIANLEFKIGPDSMRLPPAQNLVPRLGGSVPSNAFEKFLSDFLRGLARALENDLSNTRYVGPLREVASGFRSTDGDVPELKSDGSNIQEHLLRISDQEFGEVSEGVHSLTDGAYKLERKTLQDSDVVQAQTMGSVFLADQFSQTSVAFQDAGTGIAQVLPIIAAIEDVTARTAKKDKLRRRNGSGLIIIEQPELHLHPEMQARLADYLLDKSVNKLDALDGAPVILCETHSESLLLRVQRRLREGRFGPATRKAAFYFVDRMPGSDSSHIMSMDTDDSGEFRQAWPVSFAGLRVGELRGG